MQQQVGLGHLLERSLHSKAVPNMAVEWGSLSLAAGRSWFNPLEWPAQQNLRLSSSV